MEQSQYTTTFGLLVATILAIILYSVFKRHIEKFLMIYKMTKIVPLCDRIPYGTILGHASLFIDLETFLSYIRKATEVLSPPRIFRLGHHVFFIISRPEDFEVVLNSQNCLSKHDIYEVVKEQIGFGLFNLPVQAWKKHRKLIRPSFNQNVLNGFVEVFWEKSVICTNELKKCDGKFVDILSYMSKLSVDTICVTSMGYEANSLTSDSELGKAIEDGLEMAMLRISNFLYQNDFIFSWTNTSKKMKQALKLYHECIYEMIENKREAFNNRILKRNGVTDDDCNQRKAFLDILLELTYGDENEDWSNEDYLGEVSTFITAGSDTTATMLAFAIILLAMHPEIQEKCYEEVMSIVGPSRKVTYDDLPKFVYLEKVIKETMRLFPVGPAIMRNIDKDMEVGGYTLPKGSGLLLAIIGVHYSEEYYKDPYKFDPERFNPEEVAKRPKYSYIPFSKGPRNCIGMVYGIMSMKTTLPVLIRNFRFETTYKDVRDIRLQQAVVIKAVEGLPVKAIPRK